MTPQVIAHEPDLASGYTGWAGQHSDRYQDSEASHLPTEGSEQGPSFLLLHTEPLPLRYRTSQTEKPTAVTANKYI